MINLLTTGLQVNFERSENLTYPYVSCVREPHNKIYLIMLDSGKAIESTSLEEVKAHINESPAFTEIDIDVSLFREWEKCKI